MIKFLVNYEKKFLNLMKTIHKEPTTNIILNRETQSFHTKNQVQGKEVSSHHSFITLH